MPYYVNFTNGDRLTTVADQVINNSSSLSFVGKNYAGYGKIIADNFLHLMENFANTTAPLNPVEGQLWYDNTPGINALKIYNGTTWNPAGSIKKASTPPTLTDSVSGDLWVNPVTKQLSMFTGSSWELIGPQFSSGLKTGPLVEVITDIMDEEYSVLSIYAQNERIAIISQLAFTPKLIISGFSKINKGINLSTANQSIDSNKLWGTAESADALVVDGTTVNSSNFLRSDIVSFTNNSVNVRSNDGISLGTNLSFKIGADDAANLVSLTSRTGKNVSFQFANSDQTIQIKGASWSLGIATLTFDELSQAPFAVGTSINIAGCVPSIYNGAFTVINSSKTSVSYNLVSNPGVMTTRGSVRSTDAVYVSGLFIKSDLTVGIRNSSPTEALDVNGNILSNSKLIITGTTDSSSLSTGSITTSGGLAVSKKSNFGDIASFKNGISLRSLDINGGPVLLPDYTGLQGAPLFDIGSTTAKFREIHAETVYANLEGNFTGSVTGTVTGSATTLEIVRLFSLDGDVSCDPIPFNGSANVVFSTTINPSFISSKTAATESLTTDEILTYRPRDGLQRTTKKLFLQSVPIVPIGSIMPYAGIYPPAGYLFCDGSEVLISSYAELFKIISYSYRDKIGLKGVGTFALPDLRGRFPLGRDDMDNNLTVVSKDSLPSRPNIISAGGIRNGVDGIPTDRANRVHHISATTVGSGSGNEAFGSPAVTGVSGINVVTSVTGLVTPVPVAVTSTGSPTSTMNPYQTINYIIFTGVLQ